MPILLTDGPKFVDYEVTQTAPFTSVWMPIKPSLSDIRVFDRWFEILTFEHNLQQTQRVLAGRARERDGKFPSLIEMVASYPVEDPDSPFIGIYRDVINPIWKSWEDEIEAERLSIQAFVWSTRDPELHRIAQETRKESDALWAQIEGLKQQNGKDLEEGHPLKVRAKEANVKAKQSHKAAKATEDEVAIKAYKDQLYAPLVEQYRIVKQEQSLKQYTPTYWLQHKYDDEIGMRKIWPEYLWSQRTQISAVRKFLGYFGSIPVDMGRHQCELLSKSWDRFGQYLIGELEMDNGRVGRPHFRYLGDIKTCRLPSANRYISKEDDPKCVKSKGQQYTAYQFKHLFYSDGSPKPNHKIHPDVRDGKHWVLKHIHKDLQAIHVDVPKGVCLACKGHLSGGDTLCHRCIPNGCCVKCGNDLKGHAFCIVCQHEHTGVARYTYIPSEPQTSCMIKRGSDRWYVKIVCRDKELNPEVQFKSIPLAKLNHKIRSSRRKVIKRLKAVDRVALKEEISEQSLTHLGIDLGVKYVWTFSQPVLINRPYMIGEDGKKGPGGGKVWMSQIPNPKRYQDTIAERQRLNRELSAEVARLPEFSDEERLTMLPNRLSSLNPVVQAKQIKLAKLDERLTRQKLAFVHENSSAFARSKPVGVLEKLSVNGMLRSARGNAIRRACWGLFSSHLRYKLALCIKVNPYRTSQTCHVCKQWGKGWRGEGDRSSEFRCGNQECEWFNQLQDADQNASINIQNLGPEVLEKWLTTS